MKCPKCGFQSFNYLPNCKKCGRDLSEMRDKYRLGDPVLPQSQAQKTMGPAQPVVDDPFETTLPDEKDISCTANLASLPDDEVDADLADYFDEINAVDPELAATLDPDSDWAENALTLDTFGIGEDEPAEPVLPEEEPVSEAAPAMEDFFTAIESPPEESPVSQASVPTEKVEEKIDGVKAPHFFSGDDFLSEDDDFLLEDDEGLDDWLLDGEEPSWRRTADAIPEIGATHFASGDSDDYRLDATSAEVLPDDPAYVFAPEQAELPFENTPEVSGQRASLVARLLAILLDTGVLATTLALFVLAGEYLRRGQGVLVWPQPQELTAQAGPYFLVFFGLAFGYFTIFHYLGGQTPGKMASRLLVVDITGEPLQLSQAFLRSVGGLICLLPVGVGFCSALLNREGRGWNDRLAGSVVVVAANEGENEG